MQVKVYPTKNNISTLSLPCSKSLAHRAIICASLASGKSVINNVDLNDDIIATIEALKHFKASIHYHQRQLIIEASEDITYDGKVIDAHESGSTLRFLIPLLAICDVEGVFVGSKRLLERPQTVYEDIFNKQGIKYYKDDKCIKIQGKLTSGYYEVDGNISSQFISGLMFVLPLLDNDSHIRIKPPYASKSYVDLTIDMLSRFNVKIEQIDEYNYLIKGKQRYMPCTYDVEADYSQLVFFASLGLINNEVSCIKYYDNSLQGDRKVIDYLKKLYANIEKLDDGYRFIPSELVGTSIDLEDCPDLGPMLFALATQAKGITTFTNVHRLRIKESDRIKAMEEELSKLGCIISSSDNEVVVQGKTDIISKDIVLDSHNDHRIVMSLCILATIANKPIVIDNAQAINKSYPTFFEDLRKCGIKLELTRR